jgi:hypothetical protein
MGSDPFTVNKPLAPPRRWLRRNLIILSPLVVVLLALIALVLYGEWNLDHRKPAMGGTYRARFAGFRLSWRAIAGPTYYSGLGIKYDFSWQRTEHPNDSLVVVFGVLPVWDFYLTGRGGWDGTDTDDRPRG